jgi:hypothetical protein
MINYIGLQTLFVGSNLKTKFTLEAFVILQTEGFGIIECDYWQQLFFAILKEAQLCI